MPRLQWAKKEDKNNKKTSSHRKELSASDNNNARLIIFVFVPCCSPFIWMKAGGCAAYLCQRPCIRNVHSYNIPSAFLYLLSLLSENKKNIPKCSHKLVVKLSAFSSFLFQRFVSLHNMGWICLVVWYYVGTCRCRNVFSMRSLIQPHCSRRGKT